VRDWTGVIPPDAQAEYGHVWELDDPGQVSGHFAWPTGGGSTLLTFTLDASGIKVTQDGRPLASRTFAAPTPLPAWSQLTAATCSGIFGPCADGVTVKVSGLQEG